MECRSAQADFVEVLDDPYHLPVILNSRVHVFTAKIPRNVTTLFHRHKENTVYAIIAGSLCNTQLLGSDILVQEFTTGDCYDEEFRSKPIIHRVECLMESPSEAWFLASEILENKQFLSNTTLLPIQYSHIPNITIPGCRGYRLKLVPNETTGYHLLNFSGVFISMKNSVLEINTETVNRNFPLSSGNVDMGYAAWLDGPIWLELKNIGSVHYEAIILELP